MSWAGLITAWSRARRLLLGSLAALALAVTCPVGARASQCPLGTTSSCSPDLEIPLDAESSSTATTGYIGYPGAGRPGYPAFPFIGQWASIDPGRFGNAFTFDGTNSQGLSYDTGGSGDDYDHVSPSVVTVALWVKATNPGTNRNIVVRGVRNCDGFGAWGLTTGSGGGLQFYAGVYAALTDAVVRTPEIPATSIWDGNWHAVAGVFDGGPNGRNVISLWVDGREVSAADFPTAADNSNLDYSGLTDDDVLIATGSANEQTCQSTVPLGFAGSIDEVEMYQQALSATQLGELQNADATTPPDLEYQPYIQGPTISGTPKLGDELTCTPTPADDVQSPTFTWERAPRDTHFENDSNWFPISGATGNTYTVTQDDVGSRVRCHEYGTVYEDTQGGNLDVDRASNSLRADADVPANTGAPTVSGVPIANHTLTCDPGTWTNGPEASDFSYQWTRNGLPIEGETANTLTITHTYNAGTLVNSQGDGGKVIACQVTAKNDVGPSAPADSNQLHAVDGIPYFLSFPTIALSAPTGDLNPLDDTAKCTPGVWRDDYAALGVPGYNYQYSWYRVNSDGTENRIAGATGSTYGITVADLGRGLYCRVETANVAGASQPAISRTANVVLPQGTIDSQVFRVGGNNGADPTGLLALPNDYVNAIDQLIVAHLEDGVAEAKQQCKDGKGLPAGAKIPDKAPDPKDVPNESATHPGLPAVLRCQILLHAPDDRIDVYWVGGVRYRNDRCTVVPSIAEDQHYPLCPSLNIEVPSIDPTHPPTSGDDLKALESVAPKEILWDIDGNGTTDAVCPGTAPVLRTILESGKWHPRAVIITGDSATNTTYHYAKDSFNTSSNPHAPDASLRRDQVRVCATSFDPPPDPAQAPCVTNGNLGRVQITGNLCPVDVRALSAQDYDDLFDKPEFAQLKSFLLAASEDRLAHEPGVTETHGPRLPAGAAGGQVAPTVWTSWGPPGGSDPRADVVTDQLVTALSPTALRATFENSAASLSTWSSPLSVSAPSIPHVDAVKGLVDKDAAFALDQVYVTHDPVDLNGVTQDPLNGTGLLVVPSDVAKALPDTNSMVLAATDAASHLGLPDVNGIPLSTGGLLSQTLSDVPKNANDVLRETNLDDVRNQLQDQVNTLKGEALQHAQALLSSLNHLGPFQLAGDAKVHANDDGTADIEADLLLPGLSTGPPGSKSGSLSIHTTLHADLSGHIALQNLHVTADHAYLGPINLTGLDLLYDENQGLTIKGQILFPPDNDGIAINNFQLGPDGAFRALDVDYKAGSGSGIPVGTGIYLTTLGGGLNLPTSTINAHAVFSIGPSPGGGCPTAGLDARAALHFASPVSFDANANVVLVCIPLANIAFHADETGLVTLNGGAHIDAGPVYVSATLAAGIKLPNWQVEADGQGGIRDLLSGKVSAILSNKGLAGCGDVQFTVPLVGEFISLFSSKPKHVVIDISGGAAETFDRDIPPLSFPQLVANLHLFTGCDISSYRSLPGARDAHAAGAGGFAFTVPKNSGASLFSIEGAGAAPRVQLRSPSGQLFDFTNATDGTSIGHAAWGKILPSEDRTVVIVGDPVGGTWTVTPAPGSASIVRVRQAAILPKPSVSGHVSGAGSTRTLTYNVQPLTGQVVRLLEFAPGGQKLIRTVSTGGKGRVHYTVGEATGTQRTIVAEIIENGLPRENLTIARYSAPSPKVGAPRRVRVRRHGRSAIVSWGGAALAQSYYVSVRYGDGRDLSFLPRHGAHKVTVPKVLRGEGLEVSVGAISPAGRLGPVAHATLQGNMHVGRVGHLPKHHKRHHRRPKKKHH